MSSTPYRVQDLVGASPFIGTSAQTILAAPLDDIPDDAEAGDRFYFETNVLVEQSVTGRYAVESYMFVDGVQAHLETISGISSGAQPRTLTSRYSMTILPGDECYIAVDVTLNGVGSFGANPQYRSNPTTTNPAYPTGNACPIDFRVKMSTTDATCTPKLIDGWKVLNLGGSVTVGSVASVNGVGPDIDGNVQINYSHVGALAVAFASMPLVEYDDVNGYYNERSLGSSDYPHLYYGTPNPTDPAALNPIEPFRDGDVHLKKG